MPYAIMIEKGVRNFSAYVPELPGCVSTGATLEAVRAEICEAIDFHLEGMREDGEAIPPPGPGGYAVLIEVLSDEDGGGFLATVPDLPGCMSDGETHEEARRNVEVAIRRWIEEAKDTGRSVPAP